VDYSIRKGEKTIFFDRSQDPKNRFVFPAAVRSIDRVVSKAVRWKKSRGPPGKELIFGPIHPFCFRPSEKEK
jgi:hypothetical protein